MTLLLVMLLSLAIFLVIFSIFNPVSLEIALPFLADSLLVPAPLLVAVAASIGAACVGGVALWRIVSLRVHVRSAEARARKAESDLEVARREIEALVAASDALDQQPTPAAGTPPGKEPPEESGSGDTPLARDS